MKNVEVFYEEMIKPYKKVEKRFPKISHSSDQESKRFFFNMIILKKHESLESKMIIKIIRIRDYCLPTPNFYMKNAVH